MNRCGIMSIFHKNYNYGGQLQAYAMCKAIEKTGNYAEQICYMRRGGFYLHKVKTVLKKSRKVRWNYYWRYINRFFLKKHIFSSFSESIIRKFDDFMKIVPQSAVCNDESLVDTCKDYDVFISGSDQVWNPDNCTDEWFFNFLTDNRRRIAYSASIGKERIEETEKVRLKPLIEKYEVIGVRENEAKTLLNSFVDKDVTVVFDPVMLLEIDEWKVFDKWDFLKQEKYIFVYLVSYESKIKNIALKYAKRVGLKAVFVTDPRNVVNQNPKGYWVPFKDGVGLEEFIALLINATYVITNSFHGMALSANFKKDFYALYSRPSNDKENLNSRINTILDNLGLKDRLIDTKDDLTKKQFEQRIDYETIYMKITEKRNECLRFLSDAINGQGE